MKRDPVDSTSIASIGYDPFRHILEVEFHGSHDIYQYFDVPTEEYSALLAASSLGTYFNQVFKSHDYPYRRFPRSLRP